jgi:hypothetical protein
MEELDLTEKTPRTFDEDDLRDEVSHLAAFTPARTARGTKSNTAMASAPPPIPPARRAATVKPMIGSTTVPPSKLIPFLPPPEPQSPVPGSFPVVRASVTAAPPPVPTTPRVRASSTLPPPSSVRHATSVGLVVPRTVTPGYDPSSLASRSTIGEPLARGSIAPRTPAAMEAPVPAARSSASMAVPPMDAVDVQIDVAPFAADEPHVTGTPMTDDKHVALPPIADADEVTDDIDRSSARPRRSVAAIAGVAVGAALVITTIGLMIRGSGTKPAAPPAPTPAALATAPASPTPTTPALPPAPPSRPPAVEVAATTSAAAAAPAVVEPAEDEPAHADLPITSQPDGAIVTLIANGDATVVGRTPITATVDPTLTYDVVFALRDHPTMITHIDASKVHELAIDLTPRPTPTPPPARRRTKIVTAAKPAAPAQKAATKPTATKPAATKPAPKPLTKPAQRTR